MKPDQHLIVPSHRYRVLRQEAVAGTLDETHRLVYFQARRELLLHMLFLQQAHLPPGRSMRHTPRAQVRWPITCHMDEWETDTHTRDVSAAGCALRLSREPPESFRFSLHLAPGLVVRSHALVVSRTWHGDHFDVCVRFDRLNAAARSFLEDLVLEACIDAFGPSAS